MKKREQGYKASFILTIIVIVCASLMFIVDNATSEKINTNKNIVLDNRIKNIFPDADSFSGKDPIEVSKSGKTIGYLISGNKYGYSSDIEFIVGIDTEDNIVGVSVVSQKETPGLGTEVDSDSFLDQFIGKQKSDLFLKKDGGDIDAVTGATISSKAIIDGLRESLGEIDE